MNVQAVVYTNERGQDRKHTPWPLPAGWTWVSLDDLGHWTGGGTPSKTVPSFWTDGTIPWVSPKDMKLDVIGTTEDLITEEALDRSATKLVPAGSVLMVMRSGILRHSFPVARTDRPVTLNQDLRALTPIAALDSSYLARYLARSARAVLDACSKDGTTVNSIDAKSLGRFRVPVPPLAEQRRIVARIDALFEEIAEGERALDAARKDLETYRRALLKAAFNGELTADWRERTPREGTGQDLLDRFLEEKDRRTPIKVRQRSKKSAGGDPGNHAGLPLGWASSSLSQLAWASSYGTSMKCTHDGDGVSVFRIPNIREGQIVNKNLKYASSNIGLSASDWVSPGDLLIVRTNGSKDLIGRAGVLVNALAEPAYFASYLIRFRLCGGEAVWRWVSLFFESPAVRQWMMGQIASSAGQYNVSQSSLAELEVPLPSDAELDEILRRVGDGLSAIADTQHVLDAEASDVQRLRQSVLKAAFEGRLVPQDEGDEPAAMMLARIAASQAEAPRPRRGRPRAVTP